MSPYVLYEKSGLKNPLLSKMKNSDTFYVLNHDNINNTLITHIIRAAIW